MTILIPPYHAPGALLHYLPFPAVELIAGSRDVYYTDHSLHVACRATSGLSTAQRGRVTCPACLAGIMGC